MWSDCLKNVWQGAFKSLKMKNVSWFLKCPVKRSLRERFILFSRSEISPKYYRLNLHAEVLSKSADPASQCLTSFFEQVVVQQESLLSVSKKKAVG